MTKFTGEQPKITIEQLHAKCKALRNWGKWGPNDELGTLNYVTPADIVAAASLVRSGKVVSMALPFDQKGPAYGGSVAQADQGVGPARTKLSPWQRRSSPIASSVRTSYSCATGLLRRSAPPQ